ncbi:MAG: FAD-binding protein [Solirubrobacterales bacterium]|nr:FAD-binding protein [Solirubrobacterales bacterium]
MSTRLERELFRLLGARDVMRADSRGAQVYLADATESRGMQGRADAIVLPETPGQVAKVVAYAQTHDVPITTRGGGTGFAGGAVPDGGILLATERLGGVPKIDPERWLAEVPAATTTADLRRRAREEGLYYPPDPGAQEQSLIGGNIATNAGGPHTFKYGVTGRWVASLDIVLASGEQLTVGHEVKKDVSGYDLKSLLVGSEGTLGIITGARMHLIPAPEVQLPILARYPDTASGVAAIARVLTCAAIPAALEFLDAPTTDSDFTVLIDAEGGAEELKEALADGASSIEAPTDRHAINQLWRWRDGVSLQVTARHGGKVSEDITVPVTRLAEAIESTVEIGKRHGLEACSWGHAGDGNMHSTFMLDRNDEAQLHAAEDAAEELFAMALELGGSISGEHGIGLVKRAAAAQALDGQVQKLNRQIKDLLDPKGLLNPGKKLP